MAKDPSAPFDPNADNFGAPQISKKARAPKPAADELKKWEDLAGLKPDEETNKQKSEWFVNPTASTDVVESTRGADEGAITGGQAAGGTKYQPRQPLGQKVHRMIYAKHVAGADATPDVLEKHATDWDAMKPRQQYDWQQSEGKEVTEAADALAATRRQEGSAHAKTQKAYATRENVKDALFPSSDAREAFLRTGELGRDQVIHYATNPADPRQREVQGEQSTQPQLNWRTAFGAHLSTTVGVGLNSNTSHFKDLEDHIEDLSSRKLQGQGRSLRFTIKGGTEDGLPSTHMPETWFNQYGHMLGNGTVLQESQFNTKDRELLEARRSLSRAAKAHSMGLKDEAISHYSKAVEHASNAADSWHAQTKARGATNVGEAPVADWEKGDQLLTNYRTSLGA